MAGDRTRKLGEKEFRLQYQEPIGQFHVPEKPRFYFPEDEIRTQTASSTVPEIEIIDDHSAVDHTSDHPYGARSTFLIRFEDKFYSLRASYSVADNPDGSIDRVPYQLPTGQTKYRAYNIWLGVCFENTYTPNGDRDAFQHIPISGHLITDLDDPVTAMAFEFLAINKVSPKNSLGIKRIVVREHQPIAIKNWEVVHHGE